MSQHHRWLGPVRSFADRSLRAAVVRPSGTSRRHQSFVLENPVDRREGGLEFRNRSLTPFLVPRSNARPHPPTSPCCTACESPSFQWSSTGSHSCQYSRPPVRWSTNPPEPQRCKINSSSTISAIRRVGFSGCGDFVRIATHSDWSGFMELVAGQDVGAGT